MRRQPLLSHNGIQKEETGMKNIVIVFFLFLFLSSSAIAQSAKPDSAQTILNTAVRQAAASHKTVLVMFHASWCSWCKRLDTAFVSTELHAILNEYFIVTHIDVLERKEKIALLENPGGVALLKAWGGEKSGIPFLVFFDAAGKKVADSNVMPDHQNIGYPGSRKEITTFVSLLKNAAPQISSEHIARIAEYFEQHAPKQ
jgi:thioredoxin-related protein